MSHISYLEITVGGSPLGSADHIWKNLVEPFFAPFHYNFCLTLF